MAGLTLPVVLSAALIDSINPCAFGVMIFLLTYLKAVGSKKRLLKVGGIYIFTVFITYLLAGFGLLSFLSAYSGVTVWVYKIAGVILVISGLINVKELFWYKKGPSLAIPESRKPLIQKYIHKTSIPAAIVLGALVSAFELPCTGQVYLGVLSLVAQAHVKLLGLIWLVIYNFIFVLPLIIMLALVYFDKKTEWFDKLTDDKKKIMRFVMGLAMLALGLAMILGIM